MWPLPPREVIQNFLFTIHELDNAHKSQGRGPESEARGRPAWEDEVKEKLKRSKKF
jgi:hypothetical protein